MFHRLLKTGVFLSALISLGGVQALPISGSVNFQAYGDFTDDGGALNGYDFAELGGVTNPSSVNAMSYVLSGDIADMAGGSDSVVLPSVTLTLSDFNLASTPTVEWVLGPVTAASGAAGNLVFTIVSGEEIVGIGQNHIGGQGDFSFDCDTDCGLQNSLTDTIDTTVGEWSIAEVFSFTSGFNVPAPASIALLGLGLLGMGAVRKRGARQF